MKKLVLAFVCAILTAGVAFAESYQSLDQIASKSVAELVTFINGLNADDFVKMYSEVIATNDKALINKVNAALEEVLSKLPPEQAKVIIDRLNIINGVSISNKGGQVTVSNSSDDFAGTKATSFSNMNPESNIPPVAKTGKISSSADESEDF